MAKYYADGNYVEVQKGDTLSAIARDYKSKSGGATYQQLAKINNISNPNKIYIGQKIKLTSSSSTGGGGSTAAKKKDPNITHFGLDAYEEKKLFATWTWSKESQTEKYKCEWTYTTDNKNWFTGQSQDNTVDEDARERSRISEYTIPAGAKQVRFRVKPISKKKTQNGKDDSVHWTASWSEYKTYTVEKPLDPPSTPEVKIELNNPSDPNSGWKLTASLSNINIVGATHIVFEVVKDNKSTVFSSGTVKIDSTDASHSCKVDIGSEYKVRAKAYNSSTKKESKWSDYSAKEPTVPKAPTGITTIRAYTAGTVYLQWSKVTNATDYEVEYATDEYLFDHGETSNHPVDTPTDACTYISGLEAGFEYFFRVRAKNETGESTWTAIKSIILGTKPSAPTTWSSTTTAVIGETGDTSEDVYLYWVHNTEDNSDWTKAEVELVIDDQSFLLDNIRNDTPGSDDATDKASYICINGKDGISYTTKEQRIVTYQSGTYTVTKEKPNTWLRGAVIPGSKAKYNGKEYSVCNYADLNGNITYYCEIDVAVEMVSQTLKDGGKLKWRVRTTGIDENQQSDWSIERTITFYQSPRLELEIHDVNDDLIGDGGSIAAFPFYITGIAEPENQTPLSYNIVITANEPYETVDNVGNPRFINAGDVVYSKFIDDYADFKIELSAGNVDLENSVSYTVNGTVAMNSGLTGEAIPITFTVSWDEPEYTPNAELSFDPETMTTTIRPYCDTTTIKYRKVREESATYRKGSQVTSDINKVDGIEIPEAAITIGEQAYPVYRGIIIADGTQLYYCIVDGVVYKVTMSNGKYVWDNDESDKPQYLEEDTMYGERVQGATVDGYPVYMGMTSGTVETRITESIRYAVLYDAENNTYTATTNTRVPKIQGIPVEDAFVEDSVQGETFYFQVYQYDDGEYKAYYYDRTTTEVEVTGSDFVYYCEVPETVRAEDTLPVRYIVDNTENPSFTGQVLQGVIKREEILDNRIYIDGTPYDMYKYTANDGSSVFYVKIPTQQSRVYLSVYRREFDGSFTELASYLDGTNNTAITDPHPALDYARYRIVAIDKVTGAVSYADLPGYPIGGKAIVIQWDEDWTNFDTTGEDALVQPPWQGSMLQLPYNIDVSESTDPEVELIEYIGRADPVAYYGTQRRQTASWNAVIPKSDKETIYGLRRLANWLGDAYVREPSGVGYWAHIKVSFNQTHCDPSVPVTLEITRVEGGA